MRIIRAGNGADVTYDSMLNALWSYIECTLGLIIACTLSVPKLYQAKGNRIRAIFSELEKSFSSKKSDPSSDLSIRLTAIPPTAFSVEAQP
jgi:hypothetical protein